MIVALPWVETTEPWVMLYQSTVINLGIVVLRYRTVDMD